MRRHKKKRLFYLAMDKDARRHNTLKFGDLGYSKKYLEIFKEYQTDLEKNNPINPSTGRKVQL